MSFPRYPEYKDSGIEWVGPIPSDWTATTLKRFTASVESGVSVNAVDEPALEGAVGVLKTSCVYSGFFDAAENKAVLPEELGRVACPVMAGSLVVSRMNTPGLVGAAGLVETDAPNLFLPDRLWQVRFLNASPKFVHYWTLSPLYRAQVQMACAGTSASMQNLSQSDFLAFWMPFPSLAEQSAIAAFLDRETAKIDALIAEQEKLIALLVEKRQATISHAVTKGLDPDVPMKDSGVPWLGQVPAHWETWKVRHGFDCVGSGTTPPSDEAEWYDGGATPWVTTGELREGVISETAKVVTSAALSRFTALKIHPKGALLIAMYGATIGRLGILGVPATTNQACCALSGERGLTVKFTYYWLMAFKESVIASYATGGGQPNISQEVIASLRVPAPGPQEQSKISSFLDGEFGRFAALLSEAEGLIVLLRERRSALIAAAVTGQIDVRGAVRAEVA